MGSIPNRASTGPGSGRYSVGSMPLWITMTRAGSTAGRAAYVVGHRPRAAITASADSIAVRSQKLDRA